MVLKDREVSGSERGDNGTANYDPLLITDKTIAKKIFNRELGCVELQVRMITKLARDIFMSGLRDGCIYQSAIELHMEQSLNDLYTDAEYDAIIIQLVKTAVGNALSEISRNEQKENQIG